MNYTLNAVANLPCAKIFLDAPNTEISPDKFGGRRKILRGNAHFADRAALLVARHRRLKIKETELKDFSLGDTMTLEGRDGSTQIIGTVESIRRKDDFATQKATSERLTGHEV